MEFKSGMKFLFKKVATKPFLPNEEIELSHETGEGYDGSTRWGDTKGSYWTENYLLKNATHIAPVSKEARRLEETCNEERSAEVSKNFDEIKVGSWYKKRNGDVINLRVGHAFFPKGNHLSSGESPHDLVLEIQEPILVPVKRKVKKDLVAFANVYGDVIFLYNTEREAKAARTNSLGKETAQVVVKLTGTYEVEE